MFRPIWWPSSGESPAACTHNCTKYNGSVVETATSFNILYDSLRMAIRYAEKCCDKKYKYKTSWIFVAKDSFTDNPWLKWILDRFFNLTPWPESVSELHRPILDRLGGRIWTWLIQLYVGTTGWQLWTWRREECFKYDAKWKTSMRKIKMQQQAGKHVTYKKYLGIDRSGTLEIQRIMKGFCCIHCWSF
jgi:hypothetical protein